MKWIILLFLMLPMVMAQVEVQYSCDDNNTWSNISYLSQSQKQATEFVPQTYTCCFRAKNESTDWGYACQTSKEGWDSMILVILSLLPLLLAVVLLYGGLKMSEEHSSLKYFLFFFIPPSIWASANLGTIALIRIYPDMTEFLETLAFYIKVSGWVFGIISAYFFIYFIYVVFTSIAEKKKKRLEGVDYGDE